MEVLCWQSSCRHKWYAFEVASLFSVRCVLFQDLSEKLSEQEFQFRRLSQEQVDNFTMDINTAYARLRGIEQAVQSERMDFLDNFVQADFQ